MQSAEQRNYELGHAPVGRLLTRYSVPAMLGLMAHALYGVVDAVFIGQGVPNSELALAGLQICLPFQILNMACMMTVGVGVASVVSRRLGEGQHEQARRAAGTALMAAVVLALIMSALGLHYLNGLLRLSGGAGKGLAALPYGHSYLAVILLGNPFFSFSMCAHQLVRAEGNARTSMIAMLIGSLTNIALDPLFIFVLQMGVRGVAIATVIAQLLAFGFLLRYLLGGRTALPIRRGSLTLDMRYLPEIVSVGLPSLVRMGGGTLVGLAANRGIAHYGQPVHLAILGLFMRVQRFLFMPMLGILHGLRPILGFNYGAHKPQRVLQASWVGMARLTALACVGFLVLILFPGRVLSLFSNKREVIEQGSRVIRIAVLMMPVLGVQMFGPNLFQSMGKGRPALLLSLTRRVIFIVPLMLLLPRWLGLDGIWCAFPAAQLLSVVITLVWVARELRRLGGDS